MTNSACSAEANVCLTFSLPDDVTSTCYFYQVYRTGIVTTACVCITPVACLAPGDEMNLVLENNVTSCDISAGTITIQDCTPDCFRVSGTLLYTNPVSGCGILQANEKPPIAKDIENFAGSTFYANTQSLHNNQLNILGVGNLTSGQSKIIIGNCCSARTYTFRGATEAYKIKTAGNCSNSLNGSYILVNSASNETKHFFWFESIACTATPCACDTAGRVGTKVSIASCANPNLVASQLKTAINNKTCFTATLACAVIALEGDLVFACNKINEPCITLQDCAAVHLYICNGCAATGITDENFAFCTDIITAPCHGLLENQRGQFTAVIGCAVCYTPCNVCTTCNTITIVGHGLTTGERGQFTSTGCVASPLSTCTNYYVISVDPCTIKVATSRANALAGTPVVCFCLAGTGCQTFTPNGTIPNGLSTCTNYYLICVTTNTFKVSATEGGCAVNITAGNAPASNTFTPNGILPAALTDGGCYYLTCVVTGACGSFKLKSTVCGAAISFCDNSGGVKYIFIAPTEVAVTNLKNGNTTDAANGATSPGFTFCVTTQGDGECSCANDVLLSSLVSAGQSIDETARSLVKIINLDASGITNAFYTSGECCLPGIIRLEAKNLSDCTFYIGLEDTCTCITCQFSPTMDQALTISGMADNGSGKVRVTTTTTHSYTTSTPVYIYCTSNCITGVYTPTVVACTTFDINVCYSTTSTGKVFLANQASDNEVYGNRVFFSKNGIPEAVPLVNYLDVGGRDEPIERIVALRDNLFLLKTDGVYILTGGPAPNFSVRLLDNSVNITAPDSAANLNNQIYMLSTQGVATVSDTGVGVISRNIEDKIFDSTGACFNHRTAAFGINYETDRSYILWLPTTACDTVGTQAYRYNTFNSSWVRWDEVDARAGIVNSADDKLYIASGDSNYIRKERKAKDRTDYADRESNTCVLAQTIPCCSTVVQLLTTTGMAEGDVILQTQQVTNAKFNRLLTKLDSDALLTDTDYNSTLAVSAGACLKTSLAALVTKVNADDPCTCYTTPTGITFTQIKNDYNTLVGELNASAGVSYSNYTTITDTTSYESVIDSVCTTFNKVTLNALSPYVAGPVTVYKGINSVVEWSPQHFGDPSVLKQIPEGTVIFDQNNFTSAKLAFSSDVSKDFDEKKFNGRGTGYWGEGCYGCSAWGGEGTDAPYRTLIPKQKQRCRYLSVKFTHKNAREAIKILGISLNVRQFSTRAYRGI